MLQREVLGSPPLILNEKTCLTPLSLLLPVTFRAFPFPNLNFSPTLKGASIFSVEAHFYFNLLTLPDVIPFLLSVGFFE